MTGKETPMDLKELTTSWLIERGFEGLFGPDDCACVLADLMPCEGPSPLCRAGYRASCPADCGGHDFHVQEARPREEE